MRAGVISSMRLGDPAGSGCSRARSARAATAARPCAPPARDRAAADPRGIAVAAPQRLAAAVSRPGTADPLTEATVR
jgi:hypothetical protein